MDLGFDRDNKWFRVRACAVIVRDKKILMCKNLKENYYYAVGGGVRHGERVEAAVLRETFEETGEKMEIDRLLFIHQNFFLDKGYCSNSECATCHEISFYYLMKDNGQDLISKGEVYTEWICFEDFKNEEVYPSFLPDMLNNKEVKMITTCE